jgi:hypothetical protein
MMDPQIVRGTAEQWYPLPTKRCVSCSHLGLCLDDQKLIDSTLVRTSGASDLAWLDELVD